MYKYILPVTLTWMPVNTHNTTYCEENKGGKQENQLHLKHDLDRTYKTSIDAPYVFNERMQICIVMRESSMHKAEDDLKAIMYPV